MSNQRRLQRKFSNQVVTDDYLSLAIDSDSDSDSDSDQ